jgi:biotin transporter BioY
MFEKLFQMKLKRIEKRGERQKQRYELEEKYAEFYPHKNGKKVSNIMLIVIVVAIVCYTVASFVLQYHTSTEISSTLTTLWFSFWTIEACALAGIRISKVRKEHKNEYEDEDSLG